MKRLLLLAPLLAIAACGPSSSLGPLPGMTDTIVHAKSARLAGDIASCLENRLPDVRRTANAGTIHLAVGPDTLPSYRVTLTPATGGAIIKVTRSPGAPDTPPESDLRFAVARCTT